MIRLGGFGMGPLSHMGSWPSLCRRADMVMTHVWHQDRKVAEEYARQHGIPHVVDKYDGMLGQVDAVVQGGYQENFWSVELAWPYVEAGIPVFINRPGAYSLRRIRRLVELAGKHNCPLMVTSYHEYNHMTELAAAAANNMGRLTGVMADSMADSEARFFSLHCIHGWFMLYPVLAGKVRRVRTFQAGGRPFAPIDMMECENADGSRFPAVLSRQAGSHRGFMKIFGAENASYEATLMPLGSYKKRESGPGVERIREVERGNTQLDFLLPALVKFENMVKTREMPQSYDQIVEKVQVFLSLYRSLLDDGRAVEVARLEEDWMAPNPYPDLYPDGYFPKVA